MFRKNIEIGLIFGLICAIILSVANFDAGCEDLRQGVLRLHIIANSDSSEDQNLKLKVRDEILKNSGLLFDKAENLEDAVLCAKDNIGAVTDIANRVCAENGAEYMAETRVGTSYFETREYDDFTLPAGEYTSLIVTLGEAEGKNWWCVVYPAVCIPSASADLSESVGKSGTKIAKNPSRYIMRFKVVEWYENIKRKCRK
ncbi:MAG: stage II sporulation protein R [Clostridia bacterium]|nr:stage II sporulation protein R [Clostridia bacterium]